MKVLKKPIQAWHGKSKNPNIMISWCIQMLTLN
jgi:hypothetical protein